MPLHLDVLTEAQQAGRDDIGPDECLDHVQGESARLARSITPSTATRRRNVGSFSPASRTRSTVAMSSSSVATQNPKWVERCGLSRIAVQ